MLRKKKVGTYPQSFLEYTFEKATKKKKKIKLKYELISKVY